MTAAPSVLGGANPVEVVMPLGTGHGVSDAGDASRGWLASDTSFPHFIGFMSNPLRSIEPRSVTQLWPLFLSTWVSPGPRVPSGHIQLYGAGLNLALTERLSLGFSQGGYATSQFRVNRDGWLDLGGFVQYMVIRDVENQFFVTAGLTWSAPSGEAEVFNGTGPAHLAPYLTIGKEFGEFHILATTGYQFPAGGGSEPSHVYYANIHLDRRILGWLYPLVEINYAHTTSQVDLPDGLSQGSFNFSGFEATGDTVTLAAGLNAVLVQNRLEIGAVYSTPLTAPRSIDFDGLLVKMILRY